MWRRIHNNSPDCLNGNKGTDAMKKIKNKNKAWVRTEMAVEWSCSALRCIMCGRHSHPNTNSKSAARLYIGPKPQQTVIFVLAFYVVMCVEKAHDFFFFCSTVLQFYCSDNNVLQRVPSHGPVTVMRTTGKLTKRSLNF